MGRYGDPVTWLEAGDEQSDEQSDAEPEDALVVGGDVEPVGQLPQIQYEDISDAEDAPAQRPSNTMTLPTRSRRRTSNSETSRSRRTYRTTRR